MAEVLLRMPTPNKLLEGQNVGLILNAYSKARNKNEKLFASLSLTAQVLSTEQMDVQVLCYDLIASTQHVSRRQENVLMTLSLPLNENQESEIVRSRTAQAVNTSRIDVQTS